MALTETILMQNVQSLYGESSAATPETALFSSGALDSVAMLSLIMLVEEQSGIEIRADDVTLDNFDTPARILRFAEERAG